MEIYMILKSGKDWEPTVTDIRMMMRTYPNINLESELLKMEAWCYSNPGKRKTDRGILKFVNSWLSRAKPTPTIRSTRDSTLAEDLSDVSWAT
jgi:hypothetical protein